MNHMDVFFISTQDQSHQLAYIPAAQRVVLLSEEMSANLQADPDAMDEWISGIVPAGSGELLTFCPEPGDFPAYCRCRGSLSENLLWSEQPGLCGLIYI